MSIKNIFDKFFYLEEVDEEQATQASAKPAPVAVPSSQPRQEQPRQTQTQQQIQLLQPMPRLIFQAFLLMSIFLEWRLMR